MWGFYWLQSMPGLSRWGHAGVTGMQQGGPMPCADRLPADAAPGGQHCAHFRWGPEHALTQLPTDKGDRTTLAPQLCRPNTRETFNMPLPSEHQLPHTCSLSHELPRLRRAWALCGPLPQQRHQLREAGADDGVRV